MKTDTFDESGLILQLAREGKDISLQSFTFISPRDMINLFRVGLGAKRIIMPYVNIFNTFQSDDEFALWFSVNIEPHLAPKDHVQVDLMNMDLENLRHTKFIFSYTNCPYCFIGLSKY